MPKTSISHLAAAEIKVCETDKLGELLHDDVINARVADVKRRKFG
jgi:hypothetical protein